MRTRFLGLIVALVAVTLAFGAVMGLANSGKKPKPPVTPKANGKNLVVDDDKAQCTNASYTSIQAAVAAAKPGSTIKVCPGLYRESVTIPKTLKLDGAGGGSEARKQCPTTPNPAQDSIVTPPAGSPGFQVNANDVQIEGFVVQGAAQNAGIYLSKDFSGYKVSGNTLQHNTFGLYLNSSGSKKSVVKANCFADNNLPGSASGNGIYEDQGVSNARVEGNFFTKHDNAAMIFVVPTEASPGSSKLTIHGNQAIDDAPFIFAKTSNSVISENVSVRSKGSGIFFGGGVTDVKVQGNRLQNGALTGIHLRTDPANYMVTAPNTGNLIENNRVTGFGGSGIRLRDGASDNTVRENKVMRNGTSGDATSGDGIGLENASKNVLRENKVEQNRRDGIRANSASSGNLIAQNHMRGNAEHDCHDDSAGSGTAGTANVWKNDTGRTENRPGLCKLKKS